MTTFTLDSEIDKSPIGDSTRCSRINSHARMSEIISLQPPNEWAAYGEVILSWQINYRTHGERDLSVQRTEEAKPRRLTRAIVEWLRATSI